MMISSTSGGSKGDNEEDKTDCKTRKESEKDAVKSRKHREEKKKRKNIEEKRDKTCVSFGKKMLFFTAYLSSCRKFLSIDCSTFEAFFLQPGPALTAEHTYLFSLCLFMF